MRRKKLVITPQKIIGRQSPHWKNTTTATAMIMRTLRLHLSPDYNYILLSKTKFSLKRNHFQPTLLLLLPSAQKCHRQHRGVGVATARLLCVDLRAKQYRLLVNNVNLFVDN